MANKIHQEFSPMPAEPTDHAKVKGMLLKLFFKPYLQCIVVLLMRSEEV